MKRENEFLSYNEILILKGFAIFLLLLHHLFSNEPRYSLLWFGSKNILNYAAILAKLCVAIFVIVSGYGLTRSLLMNAYSWKIFYYKRFKRIFITFWTVFLIFVPLGIIFFRMTPRLVYGDQYVFLKLIADFFGLGYMFFRTSYNVTWWFMSLIICLYFFYPVIYWFIRKYRFSGFIFLFMLSLVFIRFSQLAFMQNIYFYPISFIFSNLEYIVCFSLGIYSALFLSREDFERVAPTNIINWISWVFLLFLVVYLRFKFPIGETKIDFLPGFLLMIFCIILVGKLKFIKIFLIFIGKYAYEIFLTHTFIYYYFFRKQIYSFKDPILIYFVLLCLSLLIAILTKLISNLILKFYERNIENKLIFHMALQENKR